MLQNLLAYDSGLSGIVDSFRNNWLGPVFLIVVGVVAITFLVRREIRNLLIFVVIAAIVGALIYFGDALFGSGGTLSNWTAKQGQSINTILPMGFFDSIKTFFF